MQLATRYSKLPDEVIYAAEAGWTHEVRFAFNDAVTGYVETFERMQRATKEVTARRPKASRTTYKKQIPEYNEEDLMRYLGINPQDVRAKELLQTAISPDAWAKFEDDGDWDDAPQP